MEKYSCLGILQLHPYQQEELSENEIQNILNVLMFFYGHVQNDIENPAIRRTLWYDLIFYKSDLIPCQCQNLNDLPKRVHPTVLRLLQYPIPDELRCFYWALSLGVFDRYENGYFSIIHNKQASIPDSNLRVIEADLKRMDISHEEYEKVYSVFVFVMKEV